MFQYDIQNSLENEIPVSAFFYDYLSSKRHLGRYADKKGLEGHGTNADKLD